MPYVDSSLWFAALHPGHEGHRLARTALEGLESPAVWNRWLALEVEHAIRRIRDDDSRSAAATSLHRLVQEGVLVESEPLNRSIAASVTEASHLSASHARPGDKVGAADIVHIVLARAARTEIWTRDSAQADFAERVGHDVRLVGLAPKKKAAGDDAGGRVDA